jgi:Xaa-Pro aminopeptidase
MTAKVPYGWAERAPLLELDFPVAEFAGRITRIQAALEESGNEALLIWEDADRGGNVRYLSGFNMVWGSSIVLVHKSNPPVLVTNAIAHGEPMHSNIQTAWMEDVRVSFTGNAADLHALAASVLAEWGVADEKVLVAGHALAPYSAAKPLFEAHGEANIVAGDALMDRLRAIKSVAELAIIRRAAVLTSKAMDAAMVAATVGNSESLVAAEAHYVCMKGGAERMSFGCFPSAGRRGNLKNIFPSPDRLIRMSDLVVIDLGCKLQGYQSDMSRNVVTRPTQLVRDVLAATQAANDAAFAYTRPGVTTHSVIEVMNKVIAEHGFAEWDFTLCHGFGLDLTETPMFRNRPPLTLEPGMCFYVEPIIAHESFGCACIEDMLVVNETGCEKMSGTTAATIR